MKKKSNIANIAAHLKRAKNDSDIDGLLEDFWDDKEVPKKPSKIRMVGKYPRKNKDERKDLVEKILGDSTQKELKVVLDVAFEDYYCSLRNGGKPLFNKEKLHELRDKLGIDLKSERKGTPAEEEKYALAIGYKIVRRELDHEGVRWGLGILHLANYAYEKRSSELLSFFIDNVAPNASGLKTTPDGCSNANTIRYTHNQQSFPTSEYR